MRGMRDYFGGDNKIADNDLLRPVGSVNYKAVVFDGQGEPYRVEWIVKPAEQRMEPETVAAVLRVALPPPDTPGAQSESRKASVAKGTAGSGSGGEEPVDLALYSDIRSAIGRVSGDRSADTHRIVGACFRAGLRLAQTRWAINQRADLRERLADRTDDDVARIFLKLADEHQDEKAGARTQAGGDHTGDQDGDPASKRANRHLRDRLLSLTDLRTLPPVQPLIDKLLYRDTLGQLSGPPGCYKTFVAIAMSCALAAGESFGAFVVAKPGKVVYVAAEGVSGLETRILAWCDVWEVDPAVLQDRLFVLPLPIQLGNQVEVSQAVAVVAEVPRLIYSSSTQGRGAPLAWTKTRPPHKGRRSMPPTGSGPLPGAQCWVCTTPPGLVVQVADRTLGMVRSGPICGWTEGGFRPPSTARSTRKWPPDAITISVWCAIPFRKA